jgi:3-deoxy-7-phosphoheptulonate synthase
MGHTAALWREPARVDGRDPLAPVPRDPTIDRREEWQTRLAAQQPEWAASVAPVVAELAGRPGLVPFAEVDRLRRRLADVAAGRAHVLQAGSCAEDIADCVPERLDAMADLINGLAGRMARDTGREVIRIGRIAGQFAKPRSAPIEYAGATALPVFRGVMVNRPEPEERHREHRPHQMLACYDAAAVAVAHLRDRLWTSHEALILDYELPLTRRTGDGRLYLASAHWPWIGERTRDPDGMHVRLLARVANPVACKVGPSVDEDDLLRLCELLDPLRRPGRLTLIARMGADRARDRLPGLVKAVAAAGHPVVWLCDPMHGNTVRAPSGRKTRVLDAIRAETRAFRDALAGAGAHTGGLHLEIAADRVRECAWSAEDMAAIDGTDYTTLCDPRLDRHQAHAVVTTWATEAEGTL